MAEAIAIRLHPLFSEDVDIGAPTREKFTEALKQLTQNLGSIESLQIFINQLESIQSSVSENASSSSLIKSKLEWASQFNAELMLELQIIKEHKRFQEICLSTQHFNIDERLATNRLQNQLSKLTALSYGLQPPLTSISNTQIDVSKAHFNLFIKLKELYFTTQDLFTQKYQHKFYGETLSETSDRPFWNELRAECEKSGLTLGIIDKLNLEFTQFQAVTKQVLLLSRLLDEATHADKLQACIKGVKILKAERSPIIEPNQELKAIINELLDHAKDKLALTDNVKEEGSRTSLGHSSEAKSMLSGFEHASRPPSPSHNDESGYISDPFEPSSPKRVPPSLPPPSPKREPKVSESLSSSPKKSGEFNPDLWQIERDKQARESAVQRRNTPPPLPKQANLQKPPPIPQGLANKNSIELKTVAAKSSKQESNSDKENTPWRLGKKP